MTSYLAMQINQSPGMWLWAPPSGDLNGRHASAYHFTYSHRVGALMPGAELAMTWYFAFIYITLSFPL